MTIHQDKELGFENIAVVVLAHNRTSHLNTVLASLEISEGFDFCSLVFACDRPTLEVRSIVHDFSHARKTILVNERSPISIAQAINRNLFNGLNEAFRNTTTQIVMVLEDDIVVSPDFLVFTIEIFQKYSKKSNFRGLNLFSKMECDARAANQYVIGNFGLGWGWAINRTTFEKFLTFWNGEEDNHWDFLVEPFCRTGFIVNPFRSRIKNIGMDETASHTSGESAKKLAAEIEQSFNSNILLRDTVILTDERFSWATDYFQRKRSNRLLWFLILLLARMRFWLYGSGTGKKRVTIKFYSLIKFAYEKIGNFYKTRV